MQIEVDLCRYGVRFTSPLRQRVTGKFGTTIMSTADSRYWQSVRLLFIDARLGELINSTLARWLNRNGEHQVGVEIRK